MDFYRAFLTERLLRMEAEARLAELRDGLATLMVACALGAFAFYYWDQLAAKPLEWRAWLAAWFS